MPSRHRSLGPPFLTISRGKLSQRLASLNFCLPLFLLFIYSFVISENIKSTKYILHVGRHETKRRTANCRTQKVHSSFSACQDRTNFSLYSYNFISVDTQFIASKAPGFFLISLYYPCSKKHASVLLWKKLSSVRELFSKFRDDRIKIITPKIPCHTAECHLYLSFFYMSSGIRYLQPSLKK